MNSKDLEALARGYVYFKVNGMFFRTYSRAQQYRVQLTEQHAPSITFIGYHIFKKWQAFYYFRAPIAFSMHRAPTISFFLPKDSI